MMRRFGFATIVCTTLVLLLSALLSACRGDIRAGQKTLAANADPERAELAARPEFLAGMPVVVLQGTHYERGVAHGKQLGEKILDLVDNFILKGIPGPMAFAMLRNIGKLIEDDERYAEEARGLVEGAGLATEGKFRPRGFPEDFNWRDVLALNSYIDMVGANCSSVSAWGNVTATDDPPGQTVVVRNLDWSIQEEILRNQVVFVHLPAEENEDPFVSVGFAGLLGCLSCMDHQGLGAFLNLGYSSRSGTFPPDKPFFPAALALRRAVEATTSGDNAADKLDAFVEILTDTKRVGSFIIHAVVPGGGGTDPAVVVELNPDEYTRRSAGDDPNIGAGALAATNHFRNLESPVGCKRYSRIVGQIGNENKQMTRDKLWSIIEDVRRSDTMHSLLFVPGSGELWLARRTSSNYTYSDVEKTRMDLLFGPLKE